MIRDISVDALRREILNSVLVEMGNQWRKWKMVVWSCLCTLIKILAVKLYFVVYCRPGGTVHMVCRNKDKAEEAKSEIVSESGNAVSD